MPNITKYMGRAIPGMSVIQGAWDAGQGVSSLVEALQRRAAKQSGGPVPMEDIENWLKKNEEQRGFYGTDQITPTHRTREGQTTDVDNALVDLPYMGFKEKPLMDDVSEFWQANKSWDDDVEEMLRAIRRLKKLQPYKRKMGISEMGTRQGATIGEEKALARHQLMDKLGQYLQSQSDLNKGIEHKTKAKDSIWMSVLDAMKKAEKKAEDRLGRELQGENIDRENYWEDLTDEERREVLEENWLNTGRGRRPRR
jgi:hypothetical protein